MKEIDIVSQLCWMIFLLDDESKQIIRDSIYLSNEPTPDCWKRIWKQNQEDFLKDYRILANLYGTRWVHNKETGRNRKIINHIEEDYDHDEWEEGFNRNLI